MRHRRLLPLVFVLVAGASAADPWDALAAAMARPSGEQKAAVEAVLNEHPAFLPAHFNLGTLLITTDTTAAIRHLEQAAKADDPSAAADAWHNLALARWKAGLIEDAVVAMGEAAKRDPRLVGVRDELRRAALAKLDEARRKAEEDAKKLRLDPTPPEPAHVGEVYRGQIRAAGGAGSYRFAATAPEGKQPALPPGITLGPDGYLTGTPTAAGNHALSVTVQDAAQTTANGTVTITVLPAPRISTTRLDEAVSGQPYRAQVTAEGLDRPRWTVSGLPAGLTVDAATGVIFGTPTAAGHGDIAIRASDDHRQATATLPLVIADSFAPDLAGLPPATAWAAYNAKLGIRGPAGIYTFAASPAGGLRMSADGTIAGKPEAAGTTTLDATITAADGRSRHVDVPIVINAPPVIDEDKPIELKQGQPANRPIRHQGGTPPLVWKLVEGQAPKGLRFDPDGTLRGAPGEVGSFPLTFELHDRWQAVARQSLTVQVDPAPQQPPNQDKQDKQEQQADNKQQDAEQQQQAKQQSDPGPDGDKQGDKNGSKPQKQDGKQADTAKQAQDAAGAENQDKAQTAEQSTDKAAQEQAAKDAKQAQAMRAAAADRFLDQLPEGDKDALRALLLDAAPKTTPKPNAHPW